MSEVVINVIELKARTRLKDEKAVLPNSSLTYVAAQLTNSQSMRAEFPGSVAWEDLHRAQTHCTLPRIDTNLETLEPS